MIFGMMGAGVLDIDKTEKNKKTQDKGLKGTQKSSCIPTKRIDRQQAERPKRKGRQQTDRKTCENRHTGQKTKA